MANNSLTTVFNTSPHFDDYDETRGYYRILHKPSVAVQTRELNQVQSMFQKQIDRFAEHVFQEGSLVSGGETNLDYEYNYLKISDVDNFTNSVNVNDWLGTIIEGETTGVSGIVINAITGSEASTPDTKTLFVKYTSSGSNNVDSTITTGETVTSNTGLSVNVLSSNTSVGIGVAFTINEGVLFAKDHFIRFDAQTVVIDKYSRTPTKVVGFRVDEEIITHQADTTLLDNAQGTSNYTAPGADRLKLTPVLVAYDSDEDISEDFIELLTVKEGVIQRRYLKPQYSIIKDELARRTFDESGDYVVQGLNIRIRDHLDTGDNGGLYTLANDGDSEKLAVGVGEGTAYVKGYDVENLVTSYIDVDKGIDSTVAEQQRISTNYGNYLYVNESVGQWPVNETTTVNLYDAFESRVSLQKYSATSPTGNLVGTAKLRALKYDSGTQGLANTIYRAYLYDIQMSNGSFTTVRSLYSVNGNADLGADVILQSGVAVLNETNFNTTVYQIASPNIKSIRDENNDIDTTYTFMKSFDVSVALNGTFTLSTGSADDILPFSAGALNSSQKNANFVVNLNAAQTVSLTGNVAVTSGANTVTGTGTTFTTQLRVGDKIKVVDTAETRIITAITNTTFLTVANNWAATDASSALKKQYLEGDIIPFNVNGTANVARSVSVSTSTTADFDLKETLDGTVSATVTTYLNKIDAREKLKVLRRDRYVLIDCGTNAANSVGPWNLGVPDILKITDVRKATAFATLSDGTSVVNYFGVDNGQRDTLYDHGKLTLKGTSGLVLTGADKLLVKFDFFEHDVSIGKGYFSVDSYPIDDVNGSANVNAITTQQIPFFTSPISGLKYDLRDCIDVRPTKVLTANNVVSLTNITTNPGSTTSIVTPSGGLQYPAPNENFIMDLQYYLPRRDLIVVDKNGLFSSIRGIPSLNPITPEPKADSMTIAILNIAPYPSLPASVAKDFGRTSNANKVRFVGNRRYTMKDIGTLDQRIGNLEYYTMLSLLEKNTLDFKILDGDGIDRFKNGIIVDPFTSHSVGDIYNPDYSIAIDPEGQEARPIFGLQDVSLKINSSSGVAVTGDLLTLPYSHVEFISQPYASSTRNAAGLFYRFNGDMILDPSTDYWTDVTQIPDLVITNDGNLESWNVLADAFGTQWNSWQTTWTGRSTDRERRNGATTTTTTTTSNQQRTGTGYAVTSTSKTDNYGTRVIDTSIVPYMRSRQVKVYAFGLKPNTKVFAFFDGESVSGYMLQTNSSYTPIKTIGQELITDSNGEIWALYYLPSTSTLKFTTGTKSLRFSDSITNSSEDGALTTAAEAPYSAFGLSEIKQDTIVTTVIPKLAKTTVSETRVLVDTNVRVQRPSTGGSGGNDPIAQSFMIDIDSSEAGVFITKLDLFFATKDNVRGAYVEIREVDASGQVGRRVVPFSETRIAPSDINVSDDGSIATTITFAAPVFLLNQNEYAFAIKPEANNPNISLWTAKIGGLDIASGARISSQPHSGVLFASSNDRTWTSIQDEDIKFKIYRASFVTNVSGNAVFVNNDYNFITANTVTGTFSIPQEEFWGETNLTIGSISGGTPLVGYKIRGTSSNTYSTVTEIAANSYSVKDMWAGTNYNTSESVTFFYANNTTAGITGLISAKTVSTMNLDFTNGGKIILKANTGSFSVGDQLIGRSSNVSLIVESIDDLPVNVYSLNASQVVVNNTDVAWGVKTTSNTNSFDSAYTDVVINENAVMKTERKVASKINEAANLSSSKSLQLQATLSSTSAWVSPVINKARTHSILVDNIINNDSTGENGVDGGNALNRYITRKVTLGEGQDAEDLQIQFSAYKPPSSSLLVYYKILHNEDSDVFSQRSWKPMTLTSTDVFSSSENTQDFKDFTYEIPDADLTGSVGEVRYVNSNGVTFTGFKYFAVKIVFLSSNSSEIPRVKELRGIALQK